MMTRRFAALLLVPLLASCALGAKHKQQQHQPEQPTAMAVAPAPVAPHNESASQNATTAMPPAQRSNSSTTAAGEQEGRRPVAVRNETTGPSNHTVHANETTTHARNQTTPAASLVPPRTVNLTGQEAVHHGRRILGTWCVCVL